MSNIPQTSTIERYQRLIEISRDLASTLNLDVLLSRIVHAAADLCDAEAASILLYDQVKQELHFEAATSLERPQMRGLIVPVDASIAGWIVLNRQPVLITDASQDKRHFGHIAKVTDTHTKSLLGVPLITKDKVVGVIEAINKHTGEFTQEDKSILITLGAQAAIAIENARLFLQADQISELVHELRTPLTALNTAVQLLLRPDLTDLKRGQIAEMVRDEVSRLTDLTTQYLDYARLESGRAQFRHTTFDLGKLFQDCLEIMHPRADEKGIKIDLELPEMLPPLTADEDKIKQVVLNLISNAIKYNEPKGRIKISAQAKPIEMVFSVSDTGQGIPPESVPHLFEKFYRVPKQETISSGTGLGLTICKRIIEAHNGTIDVQSTVGKGTIFTIHLPLVQ